MMNYAASRSPVYRALWEQGAAESPQLFHTASDDAPADVQRVMDQSLDVLQKHRAAGTLRGPDNKQSEQVLAELGQAGYWGLLVKREFGGSGCSLRHFLPFLTQAAVIDAPLAGLAAVHGCIGAVDPLQSFGTAAQKQRYLPALARGERLSAFASTEPAAGSDLRAIQTTAVRDGDGWRITGQKAFITNLAPSRTIGLLCKVEDQLAVFVVDLPAAENEHFELVPNPLHPLKHTINQGMKLRDFFVPNDSLLAPPINKDGRAIVFHGLNRGRAAICALAAGHLRTILTGMIAWAKQRQVQGKPLAALELIQARCARVAALIAGCDALAQWCGMLLDAGYRGEIECIIAKVFASEAVKHAAFDLALPTHGGRFFLQGHAAGDMAYDYLAPCIYEGENDLLGLAMFHALAKQPVDRSPQLGQVGTDWSSQEWQALREQFGKPSWLQGDMLELSQQVQALTVHAVVQAALPLSVDESQAAAARLLCLQLQRSLRDGRPDRDEIAMEVALGVQLLSRGQLQVSPSPQPSPRSTEERE